ncbi:hypothetical protein A1D23_06665 [Chelonobacter oris]|uniref:ATP-dependent Clp protease proteolytic subunit n=1 Tax=Chelonobacter oris TaxID=505317 RepID=UPI00068ADCE8|nr:ATP-dependent Clp protease proteolytic subunit [Chelonobacter oris]MDH2999774.1 hypothetical protein [Chelonobacter oris]
MKHTVTRTALSLLAAIALPFSAVAELKKTPVDDIGNLQSESAKIFYTAPIEANLVSDLVFAIDEINSLYPKLKNIYLYINSDGGDMDSGQIAYWAVKSSKIPVTTVNLSMVGSSATIMFCGAQQRLSLPGGKFLLHASSLTGTEGLLRPDDIDNLKKESMLYNQVFFNTYKQCTEYSDQEIGRLLHSEGTRLLLTADEVKNKKLIGGMADKIEQTPISYYIVENAE